MNEPTHPSLTALQETVRTLQAEIRMLRMFVAALIDHLPDDHVLYARVRKELSAMKAAADDDPHYQSDDFDLLLQMVERWILTAKSPIHQLRTKVIDRTSPTPLPAKESGK